MSRTSERVRAELQDRTGVDFARYADDRFLDAVTGWSVVKGVAVDILLSLGAWVALVTMAVILALGPAVDGNPATGLVLGSAVAGGGVAAAVLGGRLRRRAPAELGRVFDASAVMVDRVAVDIASGRLSVGYADAAKGLTLVAALPALTRAAQRRFPLLGTLVAPLIGSILTRALSRLWPSAPSDAVLTGVEGASRRLEETLRVVRERAVPRLTGAMRWATLPLFAAGGALVVIGAAIALISVAAG